MSTDASTDASTSTSTDTSADQTTAGSETVPKADFEKLLRESRKHEDRAKANMAAARELEALKRQSMSDTEQAVAAAREEAKTEVARQFGGRIVEAEVRAAAAGRPVDVDALLDGLDRGKFLTDDGEADRAAIESWMDRVAPRTAETTQTTSIVFPDLAQGARTGGDALALNGDPLLADLKAQLGIQ